MLSGILLIVYAHIIYGQSSIAVNNTGLHQDDINWMNKERGPLVPVWKKILKNKHQKISLSDVPVNVTQLPLFGTFDHTYRPGTLLWKTPKPKYVSGNNPKHVEIGPVYRLPVDSDDTGSQVKMEWAYANLKVRPRKLTINAVGPNKATWSIAVIEGTETSATWNLRETPSYSPLIEGFYTIQVHDQRGPNEAAKPGWLYTNSQLQVALYKTEGDHIGEVIKPSECATCYDYVMQDERRMKDASDCNYANMSILFILATFWTLFLYQV